MSTPGPAADVTMPAAFFGHGNPMNALEANRYTSAWIGADVDSGGIDQGTWSVLTHAFPDASIPVLHMSINADKPLDYHLDLGARLAPLRETGVLIIASGNIVHNLGGMNWTLTDDGYDWAQWFNEDAKERMLTDPTGLAGLGAHRDYRLAVPTPDHSIPSLYPAGLAGAAGAADTGVLVDGYSYGSLSMTAYTLGMDCPQAAGEGGSSRPPAGLPPDASNI